MKSKEISVKEYAKQRGISTQAVYQGIKKNWDLKGVKMVKKIGSHTILILSE